MEIAITKAIDECIAEGVLKDFLIEQKSEVLEMVLYSFDKELYENDLKQTAYEQGEKRLGKLVAALLQEGLTEIAALVASDEEARAEYYKKYNIN